MFDAIIRARYLELKKMAQKEIEEAVEIVALNCAREGDEALKAWTLENGVNKGLSDYSKTEEGQLLVAMAWRMESGDVESNAKRKLYELLERSVKKQVAATEEREEEEPSEKDRERVKEDLASEYEFDLLRKGMEVVAVKNHEMFGIEVEAGTRGTVINVVQGGDNLRNSSALIKWEGCKQQRLYYINNWIGNVKIAEDISGEMTREFDQLEEGTKVVAKVEHDQHYQHIPEGHTGKVVAVKREDGQNLSVTILWDGDHPTIPYSLRDWIRYMGTAKEKPTPTTAEEHQEFNELKIGTEVYSTRHHWPERGTEACSGGIVKGAHGKVVGVEYMQGCLREVVESVKIKWEGHVWKYRYGFSYFKNGVKVIKKED